MSDDQDNAESLDEDMVGTDDAVTSDEADLSADAEWPPTRAHGLPFADADVTDESFAERTLQEEPEEFPDSVSDATPFEADVDDANIGDG
ncbi:MAG: hypothetical protein JWN62_3222 [Acidimicrobiales bacterium]|nr:hypothetical protein [Acidimicrobiales bacterium]